MPYRWRSKDYCERTRRLSARLCQHVLVGVSDKKITKLQRTQNTLARITTRKYERRGVTQSLKNLHWLPIKWRIDYKIAVTTYKLITTGQPQYLCSRIERYSHMLRRSLRNVDATHNSLRLVVPATRTVNGFHTNSAEVVVWRIARGRGCVGVGVGLTECEHRWALYMHGQHRTQAPMGILLPWAERNASANGCLTCIGRKERKRQLVFTCVGSTKGECQRESYIRGQHERRAPTGVLHTWAVRKASANRSLTYVSAWKASANRSLHAWAARKASANRSLTYVGGTEGERQKESYMRGRHGRRAPTGVLHTWAARKASAKRSLTCVGGTEGECQQESYIGGHHLRRVPTGVLHEWAAWNVSAKGHLTSWAAWNRNDNRCLTCVGSMDMCGRYITQAPTGVLHL